MFDRALAWQEMLRRMIGDATLAAPAQWLVEDLYRTLALSGKTFTKPATSSRPLKFLRLKTVDGTIRPQFRVLTKEAFDYLELELGKGSDGSILVLDVRRLNTDGSESLFLRRVCLPRKEDLGILHHLKAPTPGDIAASYQERWKLNDLALNRQFDEALTFFEANRAALRNDPGAHRSHLGIARSVSPEAFAKAIDILAQDLPGDAVLPLIRVEAAHVAGNWEHALAAVDALQRVVGEDAYLQVVRANAELSAGHPRQAKEWAQKAAALEPTLDRAWWTLLNSSVKDKDYPAAVSALKALESAMKVQIPDLTQAAGFEEFVKSSEYLEWAKSRSR